MTHVALGYRFGGVHCGIKVSRKDLALIVSETPAAAAKPPTAPAAAAKPAAPKPPAPKPPAPKPQQRPAAAMPPPAPVTQTDRPAREGSFRLVHRDKVRNTTLAFKTPKLGFTLGLWKDGWIRVQRVAQTCPHFLALAPGDALLRVGDDKVPVPFPRDDFAGLLRKLSAAPRPLGYFTYTRPGLTDDRNFDQPSLGELDT